MPISTKPLVLAVVCTGLYLSYNSEFIIAHQSRITIYAVWDVVSFILNGLIFILIGLQLRFIVTCIKNYTNAELIGYGILVSAVVIISRFLFIVPAVLLPRRFSKRIRRTETFDPKNIVVFGFAGMRGVVSLAAALSLPILLPNGDAFPQRNLIVYLTFCVILCTLVVLGLNLNLIIRSLKMPVYSLAAEEYEVRNIILNTIINHIEQNLSSVSSELLSDLKNKYEIKYRQIQRTELPAGYFGNKKYDPAGNDIFNEYSKLELDVLSVERESLKELNRNGKVSEEIARKIESELDLEETRLNLQLV